MNYLEFLNLLLSLGDKLPVIFKAVQTLIADVKSLVALVKPGAAPAGGDLQLVNVTAEELEAEGKIAYAMADGGQALFDGDLLRKVFAFAKDHPQLLTFLMGLLK
jgi:hypothetical protein